MRRSIRKRKSQNRKDKLISFLAFFVFAPTVSIFLSILLIKYIILPQFSQDVGVNKETPSLTNEKQSNSEDIQIDDSSNFTETENNSTFELNRDSIVIYNIQVGSFNEITNAEQLIDQMEKKGLGGYVVKTDNYKVFAGSFYTREEADEYLPQIRESYEDVFVSSAIYSFSTINCDEQDRENINIIGDTLDLLNDAYGVEASLLASGIKENNLSLFSQFMRDNTENIEETFSKLNDKSTTQQVNIIRNKIEEIINERKNILEEVGNGKGKLQIYKKFFTHFHKYLTSFYSK